MCTLVHFSHGRSPTRTKGSVAIYRQPRITSLLIDNIRASTEHSQRGLIVAKLFYFFFFGAIGCLVPFLNVYFAQIGLSGAQIGWLGSIAPLLALISNPFWGAVSDRWQIHRYVLATCAFVAGMASLLFLSVQQFWPLMLLVIVLTFFRTPIGSLVDSTVIDLVKHVGATYGRQRAWGSVGFVLATFGLGQLLTLDDLRIAFWLHALFMGIICAGLSFFLPIHSTGARVNIIDGLRTLAGRPGYLSFLVAMMLMGIGMSSYVNFLGLQMLALGGNEAQIGLAWAANGLVEGPIMFFGASLSSRFRHDRLILLSLLGFMLVWCLIAVAGNPSMLVLSAALNGLCFGVFWMAVVAYTSDVAPPGMNATTQSLVGAAQAGLGWSLGAVLAGYLWDWGGGPAVYFNAALAALAAVVIFQRGNRS